MKKVVIVALIITLAAGAVFAEVNASAWIAGRAYTIIGDSVENSHPQAFGARDMRFVAQGQNEDGTFGGLFRYWQRGSQGLATPEAFGFVWWKPIDQVRLQLGRNSFGDFAVWDIVRGSSFYGAARDGGMGTLLRESEAYIGEKHQVHLLSNAFEASAFKEGGAELSIYPIDGLALNFGIPYEIWNTGNGRANHVYKNMLAQVVYTIPDTARIAFSFRGNDAAEKGIDISGTYPTLGDNAALFLGVYFTGVENLGVNLGLRFMLPYKDDDADMTWNYPFLIALGASYTAGDFGIKARCEFGLGGSVKNGDTVDQPTTIFFELLPSLDIGVCKVFLSAALDVAAYNDDVFFPNPVTLKKDAKVGFSINPYISKTVGPGNFFAGVRLWADGTKVNGSSGDKDTLIMFDIPIGMVVSF
ncbi:MAG: hypothetical protein FWG46_02395 [Treponema sp.]|nr:hypothetical protein [Treponema sp.]